MAHASVEAGASDPVTIRPTNKPIAWVFELAHFYDRKTGEYSGWSKPQVSLTEPSVPEGSIRNLRPLFAALAPAAVPESVRNHIENLECIGRSQDANGICRKAVDAGISALKAQSAQDAWLASVGGRSDDLAAVAWYKSVKASCNETIRTQKLRIRELEANTPSSVQAGEAVSAPASADRLAAEIALLLELIGMAAAEVEFAQADEADGSATERTRRVRFASILDALNGVGSPKHRAALRTDPPAGTDAPVQEGAR